MSESASVPAIGFSMTVDISQGRQMVLQGFFPHDESDEAVNARLDRALSFADRQRSKYEIPVLSEERAKLRDELAQYEEDVALAEENFKKSQATFDVQILEAQGEIRRIEEEGAAKAMRSGKVGGYKPQGQTAHNISIIKKQIEDYAKQKEGNVAERENFLNNIRISIERRMARIAMLDEKIAELEKALT
jgi:hypothetical protein